MKFTIIISIPATSPVTAEGGRTSKDADSSPSTIEWIPQRDVSNSVMDFKISREEFVQMHVIPVGIVPSHETYLT